MGARKQLNFSSFANKSVYRFASSVFYLSIRAAALCKNEKARLWLSKREDIWKTIEERLSANTSPIVWAHCASRGETEQALPILRAIKRVYPRYKIICTFFSPSGERHIEEADYCFFLPRESAKNVERFLQLCKPSLAIWIKYEFWYLYLEAIRRGRIPLLLVNAIFRKEQIFFHPLLGGAHREMLRFFTSLHVQNESSKRLLEEIGIDGRRIFIDGDTRFDQVLRRAQEIEKKESPNIPVFTKKIIVCGSALDEDMPILQKTINETEGVTFVIAPHDIGERHIRKIRTFFPDAPLLSELPRKAVSFEGKVLIADAMGLLMEFYGKACIAYVGGGFSPSGIHNCIEPAAFGIPVIFGENYKKHYEALSMVEQETCLSVKSQTELTRAIRSLLKDDAYRKSVGDRCKKFVLDHSKATDRIMDYIAHHRLL